VNKADFAKTTNLTFVGNKSKGLQMSINMIIILIITVMVLVVLGYFIVGNAAASQDRAKMTKIFFDGCESYKAAGCDWSVTKRADFPSFMTACKYLYGPDSEALSCLERDCCTKITNIECEGFCGICSGNKLAGVETASCCKRFDTECKTQVCDACYGK
jgi:hypothetical protein